MLAGLPGGVVTYVRPLGSTSVSVRVTVCWLGELFVTDWVTVMDWRALTVDGLTETLAARSGAANETGAATKLSAPTAIARTSS